MKIGLEAVKTADFPYQFAAGALNKSFELKSCLSIRAGQPPNTNKLYDVAPKPMSIKTKTSASSQGLPLVSGFIPIDQATFGRPHSKPLPENIESETLKISLNELLKDAEKGKYQLIPMENGYLSFKSLEKDKTVYEDPHVNKNEIVFRIKLDSPEKLAHTENEVNQIRPWHADSKVSKPDFWQPSFGDFDPIRLHAVQYQLPGSQTFNDLKVAAIDHKPITGDADILSIAIPLEMQSKGAGIVYNTTEISGLKALVKDFVTLSYELTGEKLEMERIIAFTKSAGLISSYQLLTALVVNDQFAKTSPIFTELFQHGPETNNPGAPSDLNSNMLHFYKGLPVLTESENELVAFIMQKGFLEEHFFPVHPGWNMEKWAPVIERQLELDQITMINPKTLDAYNQFKLMVEKAEANAPKIEAMLEQNQIEKIPPNDLENFDRYMRYKDNNVILNNTIHSMRDFFQESGVAERKYVPVTTNKIEDTKPPQPHM